MHSISIVGNLTRDFEEQGSRKDPFYTSAIASNESKDNTIFFNIATKSKAMAEQYRKGECIFIPSGSIIESEYEDKNGVKRKSQTVWFGKASYAGYKRQN